MPIRRLAAKLVSGWARREAGPPEVVAGPAEAAPGPDHSEWYDVWRSGTEQARRRTAEVRVDISYGSGENERFDLYLPGHRPRSLPFAAFVHGGGWREAMRSESGYPAKAVHRHGAALVVVGFDPLPAVDLAAQADQVCRAWRFLVENAERFGLDPGRGHLIGHSSGAHLAALAAFDADSPTPASAVLLSGIYDLERYRRSAGSALRDLDLETAVRLSPSRHVTPGGPAVLIAWGALEPDELRRQSSDFARVCRGRGLPVILGELAGRDHLDTSLELVNPHSEIYVMLRGRR